MRGWGWRDVHHPDHIGAGGGILPRGRRPAARSGRTRFRSGAATGASAGSCRARCRSSTGGADRALVRHQHRHPRAAPRRGAGGGGRAAAALRAAGRADRVRGRSTSRAGPSRPTRACAPSSTCPGARSPSRSRRSRSACIPRTPSGCSGRSRGAADGRGVRRRVPHPHRAGEVRWAVARGSVERKPFGQGLYALGITWDVTERKLHEQELSAARDAARRPTAPRASSSPT
jgi:hypothetical protein